MTKTRSLTIIIVVGFLVSILFSAIFSFAESLTFTAYYPSPNAFYNQLNTTYLKVNKDAQVVGTLAVGEYTPTADSDIYVKRNNEPASLMLYGQGEVGVSNNADLILASPGFPASLNDPNVWAMSHDMNNSLVYFHHRSGNAGFRPALTMYNNATAYFSERLGIGAGPASAPRRRLHVVADAQFAADEAERDVILAESDNAFGTGIMLRNTFQGAGANSEHLSMSWGGDTDGTGNDIRNKLNFWYTADDVHYDYPPPIMTLKGSRTTDVSGTFDHRVGIKIADPMTTLDVGGGAIFNLDGPEEGFLVRDATKGGPLEDGFVIWYQFPSGKLLLGNRRAEYPSVRIRQDLVVDGGMRAQNITLSGNITASKGTFSDTVRARKLGRIGCYEKQLGECNTQWRGDETEWCTEGDYVAGLRMWTDSNDDNEGYCFFLQCCRPGI